METNDGESRRDADAEALGRLGYSQELSRRMGGFSNFALSFSIICILAGGITAFPGGLGAGGGARVGETHGFATPGIPGPVTNQGFGAGLGLGRSAVVHDI